MHTPQHDLLSAYIDDACTPQETEQLSTHLQTCPICRNALAALIALRQDLRELPSPTLGFDLAAQLQDRLVTKPAPRRPMLPRWLSWHPAGLAVAASLISGLWLGTLLDSTTQRDAVSVDIAMVRVFDPIPPGGLCTASALCRQAEDYQP
ncbi:zf-HC2 domain-containing protein [Alcaligenaceae bacterium CGII-47]|nr:zf-HC2 domain-containing protein [Alcaligenaceae bacterium CGII-47]